MLDAMQLKLNAMLNAMLDAMLDAMLNAMCLIPHAPCYARCHSTMPYLYPLDCRPTVTAPAETLRG